MTASRFIHGIREDVEEWDSKLSQVSTTIDEWLYLQRQWLYLETIFSQPGLYLFVDF